MYNSHCLAICIFFSILFPNISFSQESEFWNGGNRCVDYEKILVYSQDFTLLQETEWNTYIACDDNDSSDNCLFSRLRCENPSTNSVQSIVKDENITFQNGKLNITAKNENTTQEWMGYTSNSSTGLLQSIEKFKGYKSYEIKARYNESTGPFKHSLWLFGWSTEINIIGNTNFNEINSGIQYWGDTGNVVQNQTRENNIDPNFYHTYKADITPHFIRLFIDDKEYATYSKYINSNSSNNHDLNANQILDCNLPAGDYILNPAFPHSQDPLQLIMSITFPDNCNQANAGIFEDGLLEVDYFKVYDLKFCHQFDKEFTANSTNTHFIHEDDNRNFNNITVHKNQRLEIRNTTVYMQGEILLKEGAELILTNAHIESCDENQKWLGIRCESGSDQIIIRSPSEWAQNENQFSSISDAIVGIKSINNNIEQNNSENKIALLILDNVQFENCDTAIILTNKIQRENYSDFSNCKFKENDLHIVLKNQSGPKFNYCTFDEAKGKGIKILDSNIHFQNGNRFTQNGSYAIHSQGSYPLAGGLKIGAENFLNKPENGTFNYFLLNNNENFAVLCEGNTSSLNSFINNCSFYNNAAAIYAGSNHFVFKNNTIENSLYGFTSFASGNQTNLISCNDFQNVDSIEVALFFNNQRTSFLGNSSNSVERLHNFTIVAGSVNPVIGNLELQESASNCFKTINIVRRNIGVYNMYLSPMINLQSIPFDYLYTDDNCQEPLLIDGYNAIEVSNKGEYCDDYIGYYPFSTPNDTINIVKNNLNHIVDTIPLFIIKNKIAELTNKIIDHNGENPKSPNTYVGLPWSELSFPIPNMVKDFVETNTNFEHDNNPLSLRLNQEITGSINDDQGIIDYNQELENYKSQLELYLNSLISYSIKVKNWNTSIEILKEFKPWKWQSKLYGLYLLKQDLNSAELVLNNLSIHTANEYYFFLIQKINLARIKANLNNEAFLYSEEDLEILKNVGLSPFPCSGYARSIYSELTNQDLPINLPLLFNSNSTENLNDTISNYVNIYPNPIQNETLFIESGDHKIVDVQIVDANGRLLLHNKNLNTNQHKVHTGNLPTIILFVIVQLENGEVSMEKILNVE